MPDCDEHMLLAFDFGLKRIGLAIGQTSLQLATALTTLLAKDGVPQWQEIETIVDEWQVKAFVIGIPYTLTGGEQTLTRAARRFAAGLQQQFKLPVYEVDERMSTIEAKSQIYAQGGGYRQLRKAPVDSVAAALILQQWFTMQIEQHA